MHNRMVTKDMYGYEMIETLREKSENVFELKAVTCITYFYIGILLSIFRNTNVVRN